MSRITTSRLYLRPPCAADAEALVRGLDNINVSRWTGRVPYPYGLDDAEAFLSHCGSLDKSDQVLAITCQGDMIGVIGIEKGELGYWLAQPHWGKGFGSEAAHAMTGHGFGTLGLARMTASYHVGNDASRRILQGLGFTEIGEARAFSRARQEEVRLVTLALTRDGWQKAGGRRP
jgi:RimJ/RimL family protein N-acetyltransferase